MHIQKQLKVLVALVLLSLLARLAQAGSAVVLPSAELLEGGFLLDQYSYPQSVSGANIVSAGLCCSASYFAASQLNSGVALVEAYAQSESGVTNNIYGLIGADAYANLTMYYEVVGPSSGPVPISVNLNALATYLGSGSQALAYGEAVASVNLMGMLIDGNQFRTFAAAGPEAPPPFQNFFSSPPSSSDFVGIYNYFPDSGQTTMFNGTFFGAVPANTIEELDLEVGCRIEAISYVQGPTFASCNTLIDPTITLGTSAIAAGYTLVESADQPLPGSVPEPGSLTLTGLSLLALTAGRRKQKFGVGRHLTPKINSQG